MLLIGDGEEKKNYIKLANKLGIVNDINFTGFISNEHLHPQYQKMDIVVIPSIRESFGISVLEGMSCEIPVIASDISGFNEVGNNETITFFELENEIGRQELGILNNYTWYDDPRRLVITLSRYKFVSKICL